MRFVLVFLVLAALTCKGQIAKDKCKFLGNVIGAYTPTDFNTLWNQVSPENAGKWGSVEASKDVMVWDQLDNAYKYAKDNGVPFKQHTLVWGQQQPAWISALPPADQMKQVEEWIKLFCERYPDTDFIDVVNEPLHAVPVYSDALGGKGTTGWDWVVWAFEKAKAYCPKAKLILNDYNIIGNNVATLNYLDIIKILKDRSLIDIIGEQGHFLETTPNSTITSNLDKLYATGLPIHISEYDINLASDAEQKAKYESQFPALWGHKGVYGVTLWGYKQGEIWRTDSYLLRSNGTQRPALEWLKGYVAANAGGAFCLTTGVEDHETGLQVYPNPAPSGNFTLESSLGEFDVHIRDLQGRVILERKVSGLVPVSLQVPVGLYFIEISNGTMREFRKLVLE
ncbi:MAG TPA: endo-1,4-beta-xylanase [Cyclobacteriaceae bacterium]|nr:endo-1,4-beta-xylanase [Cyclobacteriaceae bacterium]